MAAAAKNDQANSARSTTPRAPPTPIYYVIGTTYVYMHSFVHAQANMHARSYAFRMHESVRAEKHTYSKAVETCTCGSSVQWDFRRWTYPPARVTLTSK